MTSVETGQMSAVETRQMSSAETRQMYNSETGQRPVLPVDICLVSAEDICLVLAADICPVSTADICRVSTEDICPVQPADLKSWLLLAALGCCWLTQAIIQPVDHFLFDKLKMLCPFPFVLQLYEGNLKVTLISILFYNDFWLHTLAVGI